MRFSRERGWGVAADFVEAHEPRVACHVGCDYCSQPADLALGTIRTLKDPVLGKFIDGFLKLTIAATSSRASLVRAPATMLDELERPMFGRFFAILRAALVSLRIGLVS
jgi:hypothetical protein